MSRRRSDRITERPRREIMRPFEEQPQLLGGMEAAMAAHVGRLSVEGAVVPRGRLQPAALQGIVAEPMVMIVLEGLLAHVVWVGGQRGIALAGPGDVLHPWADERDYAPVLQEESWAVLERVRLALVDRTLPIARQPEVLTELFRRAAWTSRSLAIMRSLVAVRPLTRRTLMALWLLAHRWGRTDPSQGGIVIPFAIPQGILADLVGAHRQSVNEALRELRATELVSNGGGRLILHGAPPEELCMVPQVSAGALA